MKKSSVKEKMDQNRLQDAMDHLHRFLKKERGPLAPLAQYVPCPLTSSEPPRQKISDLGFILLAGGQATRMNLPKEMPKALLPITAIQKKSLIQFFFEKIAAFQKLSGTTVHVAIFVSQWTKDAISSFLEREGSFGIPKGHISFIQQQSLPLFDEQGSFLLDDAETPLTGPDGNGSLLVTMKHHDLFELWQKRGVQYVSVGQIDNPLLDPFYGPLLNAVQRHDLVFTAIQREVGETSLGLFAKDVTTDRITVVEYSEISSLLSSIAPGYSMSDFQWANISQCAFQMSWAINIWDKPLQWHVAKKVIDNRLHYKLEQFFFDTLEHAESGAVLAIDRDHYFAPIKQREGKDSLEEARAHLQKRDRKRFEELFPSIKTQQPLELHPFWEYYSPPHEEKELVRLLLPSGYMQPQW